MSSTASWSYNKPCTLWKRIRDADGSDTDGGGQPYGFQPPINIMCDYIGGLSSKLSELGKGVVVKTLSSLLTLMLKRAITSLSEQAPIPTPTTPKRTK